jgi:hypothetical protein
VAVLRSGGRALVPGDPGASLLLARVRGDGGGRRMPPPGAGPRLSAADVETLHRWIEQGAEWPEHWAYRPPRRPPVPAVRDAAWARNPIDRFILARLELEGLRPSPEADRTTLIRRVTLDLTGLPPTPAEVDAFLADPSPDAYERLVDRLLASPAFGERLAQAWLDLARYADTNGYQSDGHRDVWKWREWVINAFNANQPFDAFTVEQLAGDLLPGATLAQRVATGFNRNHPVTTEGGADPAEYLIRNVVDRVNTVATVWLGTTLACAECHDHKYDPFTQRDYYRFFAFFHNVPERGALDYSKGEKPLPQLAVPTPEQAARLETLRARAADVEARMAAVRATALHAPANPPASEANPALRKCPPGEAAFPPCPDGLAAAGLTLSARPGPFPRIERGEVIFARVFLDPGHPPRSILLRCVTGGGEHRAYWGAEPEEGPPPARRRSPLGAALAGSRPVGVVGLLVLVAGLVLRRCRRGRAVLAAAVVLAGAALAVGLRLAESRGPGQAAPPAAGAPAWVALGPLPEPGKWGRLEAGPRALGLPPDAAVVELVWSAARGDTRWGRAGILSPAAPEALESLPEWEASQWRRPDAGLPKAIRDVLAVEAGQRSAPQREDLGRYFARHVHSRTRPLLEQLERQRDGPEKARAELEASLPTTLVMGELSEPRDTYVLVRGDFQSRGEKVTAGVPAVLPPLPEGARADRLALARWLVRPDHPLTARVTVNRLWEQLFGTGLVKTGEDFGSQGEWPSHPELLDYLATEFVRPAAAGAAGWDVKALVRLMVRSAAYRQASRVTPELLERDPDNRLLARGPRFRLPAETIRDNALAASGLLDRRPGGPSVLPYQPDGLWDHVEVGDGPFDGKARAHSTGRDLYRRGIYTYWKRSMPHPSLTTFDAPDRQVCVAARPRTNTPLQALVLLNDPIYLECARGLGQRAFREGGTDLDGRLRYAFRLCTARLPGPGELDVLRRVYRGQRARFDRDPAAADRLLGVGALPRPAGPDPADVAAWTAVGNVLLNLDETITRE